MIQYKSAAFYQSCFALCLAAVVVFANLHLLQPLLPQLSREFQLSPLQVSLSYTIATFGLGLSLLVYASLSDAWGRKTLLLFTLLGVTLSTVALTQVESFTALLCWRAIQGICLGGLPAIAIAWMGEEYSTPALVVAVGYYISANSLGGIGGRLLAGSLADLGHWQWVFWPMAFLSAASCYFIWRYLPVSVRFTPQPFRLRLALQNHAFHLCQPTLLLTYLIGGLNFLVFLNQYTFISFVLAAPPYLLSSSLLGLLFITYFSGTVGSAFSAKIARRLSPPLAMALGILLMMLGTVVTLHSALWLIVSGFFISAFGFFLCHSLASSWVNQHAQRARASASALYLVFYYVGASVGSLYLQPFWQWQGWTGVIIASLAMYSLTLALTLSLWYRSHSHSP
ncbi:MULTISPECIES: MFS transporter [unclassified Arsukibacterium]|uniref:MFS transporter n=1 Tax=unclassified Arsukibacterium TaxID=2635278 RepID=UPI000C3A07E8|nr:MULTISPECIES: MFS transporter [unclassified Arsukibacterium]MAA96223.1 MFS transporter [Rheinheimera sp.]MBM35030.1 MFS transporter [Rheinheimera sp.]HAW92415.1 MFS transporter [Candidatus Azambacteria bacterium]